MVGIILWSELTDDELLKATVNGECDAFTELVRRWWEPIVAFINRRVCDFQVAEDMANRTFLDLYRGRHRYQPKFSAVAWIYRNARWELRNIPRRKRWSLASAGSLAVLPDRNPSPAANVMQTEAAGIVRRSVAALAPTQRRAIEGNILAGETFRDLATEYGVSFQAIAEAGRIGLRRLAADENLQRLAEVA